MRDEIYSREMRWNELFSKAVYLFLQNFPSILVVLVVIFLPISLLEGVILDRMTGLTQALQQLMHQIMPSPETMEMMAGEGTAYMLHIDPSLAPEEMQLLMQVLIHEALYFAVLLFLQPVGIISIAKLTKQRIDGKEISVRDALLEALNLEPTIIVSGVIYGVLITLGSMILIPGIYFSIAWGLYLYCIGLGERKGWDALRHSKELVKGKWWRTLGYFYIFSAMAMLWNTMFQSLFMLGQTNMLTDILYHFLCYFSAVFVAIGEALLFINREAMAGGLRNDGYHFLDGDAVQIEEKNEE